MPWILTLMRQLSEEERQALLVSTPSLGGSP